MPENSWIPSNDRCSIRRRTAAVLWTFLTLSLTVTACTSPEMNPVDEAPWLDGQLIVDPDNASHFAYNRDRNGDGRLDPAYLIGPGDPEGFLFLGERRSDGTRDDSRQTQVLDQMEANGGNVIYFQAVRSHGGDGTADHNPWVDPEDPASGLSEDVINQWHGWFDRLEEAGIVALFFIYDDGAHPFDDGCSGAVSDAEDDFIRDLVDAFEGYSNLIWVIQEEIKYVGHSGERRPCDDARIRKAELLADRVEAYDDHDHPIGVHHNIGEDMEFSDHPSIDVYLQQADVRPASGRGNVETFHDVGLPGAGFDVGNRFVYFMAEGYNWHPHLIEARDRAMLRKSYYATAMAGGHVTVLGMYPTEEGADPTDEMLEDMRRMQTFFESTNFNEMEPNDDLRYGDTQWVLAGADESSYILYHYEDGETLGVRGLPSGTYSLRWFDPADGAEVAEEGVTASGDTAFDKPADIGAEAVLYVHAP